MPRALNFISNLFPIWVALACIYALVNPSWIAWYSGPFIVWGLGIIMLGMGITLSIDDFKRVAKMPSAVAAGVGAQFLLMPLLGWGLGKLLALPTDFAVGLILVSCCPGGTASNVVVFIARANVALSVLMTMCSTAAAVFLTPLLTSQLAGTLVEVDGFGMFVSMVKIVLLPVAAGVAIHHLFPRFVKTITPFGPLVSVIVIALICASILGARRDDVITHYKQILIAVTALHLFAFGSGYLFAKLFGYDKLIRRTISIEVGMQNSGLATALATKHFAATPLTAVPGAISAVMHSVIGSALAGFWRWKSGKDSEEA